MGQSKGTNTIVNETDEIIRLVEYQTCNLALSEFTEEDAQRVFLQFGGKITVEWPTPKTANQWQLTSQGWVGFVPLSDKRGISLQPKVPLNNLFRMLEYAYDIASFKLLDRLYDCESIRDFYDTLAVILSKRLLVRAREGLYKTYQDEYESIGFVRGRIDIATFSRTAVKSLIPCSYEDHTIDNIDNQIVACTLHTILRSGICSERSIPILRKAERVLRNSVSLKSFFGNQCVNRCYNRLNKDYEVLHKLCRFFLDNTGPTQNYGDRAMVPFLIDMAQLFELFVARWLKKNLDSRYILKTHESLHIGEKGAMRMNMDLVIFERASGKPLCVLDTKYKAHSTVSRQDYNQVVAYGDALHCNNAMLIYPKELENLFDEMPGNIRVRTAVFDIGIDLEKAGEILMYKIDGAISI